MAIIELICADATEYEVPDDVTIIYFGNPFLGSIFEKVVGKIQESLDRNPRELVILYYHLRMHEFLVNAGFTRERQRVAQPNDWAIHRHQKPRPDGLGGEAIGNGTEQASCRGVELHERRNAAPRQDDWACGSSCGSRRP